MGQLFKLLKITRKKHGRRKVIIAIGTKNPTKVNAVKAAFTSYIKGEFVSINVPSNVSAQPLSDNETMTGAVNRAKNALEAVNADIGFGLEGGLVKTEDMYFLCNWGAMIDHNQQPIIAGGARIVIPNEIGSLVFNGSELSDVMDMYVKKHNVRQNEGAIGIFTNGIVDRTKMFTELSNLLVGQYLYQQKNKKLQI
jgi:inosine/xanthosine triphosphatase